MTNFPFSKLGNFGPFFTMYYDKLTWLAKLMDKQLFDHFYKQKHWLWSILIDQSDHIN